MTAPPYAANVFTFVGLPPTPCFFDRLRVTAEAICDLLMPEALEDGTHFGYPRLLFFVLLRPHFSKPPPFLGAEISTQFPLEPLPNHSLRPPLGLATRYSGLFTLAFHHSTTASALDHYGSAVLIKAHFVPHPGRQLT